MGQLAFSFDGKLLAAALSDHAHSVAVWEIDSGALQRTDSLDTRVSDVSFLRGSHRWVSATGSQGGVVRLWSLDTRDPKIVFDQSCSELAESLLSPWRVPYVRKMETHPIRDSLAIALPSTRDLKSQAESMYFVLTTED